MGRDRSIRQNHKILVAVALGSVLCSGLAQTLMERKAAAEAWLARKEIRIHYVGPYEAKYTVDMKDKTTMFYESRDRYCMSRPLKTDISIDNEAMLVFHFSPNLRDCAQFRYTFDPLTKRGVIHYKQGSVSADAPWQTSPNKVTLLD